MIQRKTEKIHVVSGSACWDLACLERLENGNWVNTIHTWLVMCKNQTGQSDLNGGCDVKR
jgi:hypothetical protein